MRRADIFLLISGAFYTLERCAALLSKCYGLNFFLENIFMWVFLALALFEYGRLLRARRKSGKPDARRTPTNHNAKRPALCGPFFPAVTLFCHILQNPNGNFSPAGIAPTARAW